MAIMVEPEVGVKKPPDLKAVDLKTRTKAAANTAKELEDEGLDLEPTAEDKDVAAKLSTSYAENPEETSKKVTNDRAATLTPASLILTNSILDEFGQSVVKSAVHIRHTVTNKLILETENPDAKIRIRALELLGKISDVGLFSEKSEVTITHQSTDDLKAKLRKKLEKLAEPEDKIEDAVVIEGESFNVDDELGIKDD
jgi:hypothetical protein|tara:strand:+ start:100 stop:693 length:594 start_codon:yes stop_codon:yes gene_type:complete